MYVSGLLLLAGGGGISGKDKGARLWDPATGKERANGVNGHACQYSIVAGVGAAGVLVTIVGGYATCYYLPTCMYLLGPI
jgi:hypothetical protein